MEDAANRNSSASRAQLRLAQGAENDQKGGQSASLAEATVQVGSKQPLPRPPAGLRPACFVLAALAACLFQLPVADSGKSVLGPGASAATTTSAKLPLCYARHVKPIARTGGEFRYSLTRRELALGFEARQTAHA